MRGARAVRKVLVDDSVIQSFRTIIVWIPMMDGDELASARTASELFLDPPLPQFWDGERRLGKDVSRSLGVHEWVAWDVYLFYPPGAEWTSAGLPEPEALLAQVGGVVMASRGTLPPDGDFTRIPKELRDRFDVVGAQSEFETLLSSTVRSIAGRSSKR